MRNCPRARCLAALSSQLPSWLSSLCVYLPTTFECPSVPLGAHAAAFRQDGDELETGWRRLVTIWRVRAVTHWWTADDMVGARSSLARVKRLLALAMNKRSSSSFSSSSSPPPPPPPSPPPPPPPAQNWVFLWQFCARARKSSLILARLRKYFRSMRAGKRRRRCEARLASDFFGPSPGSQRPWAAQRASRRAKGWPLAAPTNSRLFPTPMVRIA